MADRPGNADLRSAIRVERSGRGAPDRKDGRTSVLFGGRAPLPDRPALRAGNRNSLARLRRAAASSDWSLLICERGAVAPLSHFPPGHAGSEQSSLPLFLRARKYATALQARGRLGTPTSGRHRAGARNCANDVRPCQRECRTTFSCPAVGFEFIGSRVLEQFHRFHGMSPHVGERGTIIPATHTAALRT